MKRVVLVALLPIICIAQSEPQAPTPNLDFATATPAASSEAPTLLPAPKMPTEPTNTQTLIDAIKAFDDFENALYKNYQNNIDEKKKLLTGPAYENRRSIVGQQLAFIDKATKEVERYQSVDKTVAIESDTFAAIKEKKFEELTPQDCAELKAYLKNSYNRMGALLDLIAGANQFLSEAQAIQKLNS